MRKTNCLLFALKVKRQFFHASVHFKTQPYFHFYCDVPNSNGFFRYSWLKKKHLPKNRFLAFFTCIFPYEGLQYCKRFQLIGDFYVQ